MSVKPFSLVLQMLCITYISRVYNRYLKTGHFRLKDLKTNFTNMTKERKMTPNLIFGPFHWFVRNLHTFCAAIETLHKNLGNVPDIFKTCPTYQAEKAYFVDSDYMDKTISYLLITIKCGELVWNASRYLHRWGQWAVLSNVTFHTKAALYSMYHFEIKLYTQMPFGVIPHPHMHSHIGIASLWPVFNHCQAKHIRWVHIPLILYKYISYIIPIFLFPKFLYSYISEAQSCLTPWAL